MEESLGCSPRSLLNILACVSSWKVSDKPLPSEQRIPLLAHFSENLGFMSLSPLLGGNIFSIAFGRNLDAHTPMHSNITVSDPLPPSAQCLEGQQCYVSSLHITVLACVLALIVSIWVGYRDRRKMTSKDMMRAGEEVIWEELDECGISTTGDLDLVTSPTRSH
jgi:hypothetical protein